MDGGAPRLPRLGGHHAAASTRNGAAAATPSTLRAPAQASRVHPAHASRSPDRADRPYIDVGYDDDGIPHASRRSSTSSLALSNSGAPQSAPPPLQPPPRHKPVTQASAAASPQSAAWEAQVKDEVLRGAAHRQASPEAAAAIPREEVYAALEEEEDEGDDVDVDFADDDVTPARADAAGHEHGTSQPQHRFPVMVPSAGQPGRADQPPMPVMGMLSAAVTAAAAAAPGSPVSPTSSIATDTPRSILRQPGTATRQSSSRTGRRRISFVGVSPPRPEEHQSAPRRSAGGDESSGDEYESAEPSLYYDSETPPASAAATPPQHARKMLSGDASTSTNTTDANARSRREGSGDSRRGTSPSPPTPPGPQPKHAAVKSALMLSPERPERSSRSLTQSPPRDDFVVPKASPRRSSTAAAAPAGTVPSAPPPPEEEGDEVTLDVAPAPWRQRQQQQQLRARSPTRPQPQPRQQHLKSPERDEDVLTQPHNHSERTASRSDVPAAGAAAAAMRRPPVRQRWPADAYLDDPPTEASDARRTRQGQRERLDPEDDMGSATGSSRSATGSSSFDNGSDSDDSATPLRYRSPVKATTRDSPPQTTSPPQAPTSPSGRLPQRHPVEQHTRQHDHHRNSEERPHHQAPAERAESVEARGGAAPSRSGDSSSSHSSPQRGGRETRAAPAEDDEVIGHVYAAAAAPLRAEAGRSPSPGHSPSTITERSSGQSVAEDASHAAQGARRTPTPPSPHQRHHHHSSRSRSRSPYSGDEASSSLRGADVAAETHAAAGKPAKKSASSSRGAEPQVYVDPLLRERRLLHERARNASPPYVDQPHVARPVSRSHHGSSGEQAEGVESPQRRLSEQPQHQHAHRRRHHRNSASSPNGAADSAAAPVWGERRQSATMPVSLRDAMARHDSPAAQPRRRSDGGAVNAILRRPSAVRQLQTPHETSTPHSGNDDEHSQANVDAGAARRRRKSGAPPSPSVSSTLSSGGVPADALVWEEAAAAAPASPAGGRGSSLATSPPLSPMSMSSTALATTPGGHKVLRKKLVVVVRRRRSGTAPSEEDPVVQLSMLPFKQGAAALLPNVGAAPSERRHSLSSEGGASAPMLEKLIDHVEPKRRGSVTSRRSSRTSPPAAAAREGLRERVLDGDSVEISEDGRLRFRRALSGLSSRSVSPRTSVPPSAMRSRSPRTRSSPSQENDLARRSSGERSAVQEAAEGRQRRPSRLPESHDPREALPAGTTAKTSTSTPPLPRTAAVSAKAKSATAKEAGVGAPQPRARNGSPEPSATASQATWRGRRLRHHHRHHSSRSVRSVGTQSVIEEPQQGRAAAATAAPRALVLPDAPYRETQNDEYYGAAADMAADVAALATAVAAPLQERIGITPMAAPLLPRLALHTDAGLVASHHARNPRSNTDAGQSRAEGVWSGASSENGDAGLGPRVTAAQLAQRGASSHSLKTLQYTSGTQTERGAGAALIAGSTRAGMPLYAATPVQHVPVGGFAPASLVPRAAEAEANGVDAVDADVIAAGILADAGNTVHGDAEEELPASFVKRPASRVSALPSSSSVASPVSRLRRSSAVVTPSTSREPRAMYGSAASGASASAPQVPYVFPAASPPPPSWPAAVAGFHPAAISAGGGAASVPLFVPPLTVDSVAHLSQEWQSTLRERTGKAKQSAMEHFLIASAEAGAAEAAAVSSPQYMAPRAAAQSAMPGSAWAAQRGWPAQEYYGQSAAAAAVPPLTDIAAAPLSTYSANPQSFWALEQAVQRDVSSSAPAAKPPPPQQQQRRPSARRISLSCAPIEPQALPAAIAVPQLSSAQASPRRAPTPAEAAAEPVTDGFAVSPSRRTAASAATKRQQQPQSRRGRSAETLSDVESSADEVDALPPPPSASGKNARDRAQRQQQRPSTKQAATPHRTVMMSPPVFTVVESAPETRSTRVNTKKSDRHDRRKNKRDDASGDEEADSSSVTAASSASSSSSVAPAARRASSRTKTKVAKRTEGTSAKEKKGAKERRSGRQRGHERHRRRRGSSDSGSSDARAEQPSSARRASAVFALDAEVDSDVEGDLATSMEFQLSRLQLMREASAFLLPSASAAEVRAPGKDTHHAKRNKSTRDAASKSRRRKTAKIDDEDGGDERDSNADPKRRRHRPQSRHATRHRQHRSRSSGSRSPEERANKRAATSGQHRSASARSDRAGEADATRRKSRESAKQRGDEATKPERHRQHRKGRRGSSATPPRPEPLPPPPQPSYGTDSRRYPHRSARDGDEDVGRAPFFVSRAANLAASSRSCRSASLYSPRDDGDDASAFPRSIFEDRTGPARARYSSARPHFRSGSVFSDSRAEESRWHRSPSAADGRGNSPLAAYRNRRPSAAASPALGTRGRSPVRDSQRAGVGGVNPDAGSPTPRWASTARRPYTPTSAYDGGHDRATAWRQRSFSAAHSTARRPSTRWDDYVREAELGGGDGGRERAQHPYRRRSSPTTPLASSYAPASPSLAQQRRRNAEGRAYDSTARGPPRQPTSPRPYTASYTSPRPRPSAEVFDDIDDIPRRQYFNDDAPKSRTTAGAARRDATSDPLSTAQPSRNSYAYQRGGPRGGDRAAATTARATAASRPRRRSNADDLLVSTPPQEEVEADAWTPDEELVGNVPRAVAYGRAAARPPPPPPSPPYATAFSTSAAPATKAAWAAQLHGGAALPIAAEHIVTDAQAADDFVSGVTHIIDALKRYKAAVA